MLLFGHIGITLGTALGINHLIVSQIRSPRAHEKETNTKGVEKQPINGTMIGIVDIFCCAIGSILPDLIDKPTGHFLFSQTFGNNGRIFSHTLLFALVIFAIGLYIYLSKKATWGLFLSFGVFMHLTLDFMWSTPQTLFWPLMGFNFPRSSEVNWLGYIWHELLSNPLDYITELIGLSITVIVIYILVRNKYIRLPHIKKVADPIVEPKPENKNNT